MWQQRGPMSLASIILSSGCHEAPEYQGGAPKHRNLGRPIDDPRPDPKKKSRSLRAMLKSKGRR